MAAATWVVSFSRAIAVSPLPFASSLRVPNRVYAMAATSKTKIYGLKLSTCTKRVLTALEEKNVTDYEFVTVDLSKGEQKSAEFKKKQPFGVIPVLEDEDVELFESRAIARYVADKYSEQGTNLLGSNLKERALVNLWLEVESQNYNPPISGLIAEKIFKPRKGLAPDEVKVAEHKAKLSQVLDVLSFGFLRQALLLTLLHLTLPPLTLLPLTFLPPRPCSSRPPLSLLSGGTVQWHTRDKSSQNPLTHFTLIPCPCPFTSSSSQVVGLGASGRALECRFRIAHSSHARSSLAHAPPTLHSSSYQVVGLGASGRAAARLALARGAAAVVGLDKRTDAKALEDDPSVWDELPEPTSSPPLISRLSTHLGPHHLPLLLSASLVVLSPGVPLSEPTISQALSQALSHVRALTCLRRHFNPPLPSTPLVPKPLAFTFIWFPTPSLSSSPPPLSSCLLVYRFQNPR
ncbi:unnamed protein product [Closterium sp. Naga37s-1]|nr:unnamed protein product [Closterium sp. Naga37s-1]